MSDCVVCGDPTANKEKTRSYAPGESASVVELPICKECQNVSVERN